MLRLFDKQSRYRKMLFDKLVLIGMISMMASNMLVLKSRTMKVADCMMRLHTKTEIDTKV